MTIPYRIQYSIEAFDGGLNSKYDSSIIDDTESPDCLNVTFDELGAVRTRYGSIKLNTTTVGTFACDGLFTNRLNNGNQTMVAFFGGTMYALTGTSTFTTIGSAQSVFTAGQQMDYCNYQNIMFMGNGGVNPYKYNGSEFTRHGIPVPSTAPTVATSSAGVLNGVYSYKTVFVNSYSAFGNPTSASTGITVTSSRILVSDISVAPTSYGVSARRIYRTVTSGTTYYLLTTINDNSTTSYEDNTADSSLGAEAPSTNTVPSNYHIIKAFQERLFAVESTNPQYVVYTEIGAPFSFPLLNFIKISDGDGEKIVSLSIQGNALIVTKEASIWAIYMPSTTPGDWQVVKINSKYGGISKRTNVDYENFQMFAAMKFGKLLGFVSLNGATVQQDQVNLTIAAINSDSMSGRIDPDIELFNDSYANKIAGIEYNNKLYFAVPYGTSQETNNRIYVYDFVRRNKSAATGAWIPWTNLNAACFTIYNGKLYFGDSSSTGFVRQLEYEGIYSDDGSAINSYYYTKEFDMGKREADFFKDFRYLYMLIGTPGIYDMSLFYRVDSDASVGNQQVIDVSPTAGSNWGTMIWGTDQWAITLSKKNVKVELGNSTGTRIQFRFTNQNTVNQAFIVKKATIYYNRRGYR